MLTVNDLILFVLVIRTPAAWVLVCNIGDESGDLFLHLSLELIVGVVDIDFILERPRQIKINRFCFIVSNMGGF